MFWGVIRGTLRIFGCQLAPTKSRWFGCPPSRCWKLRSRAITGPPSIKVLKVFLEEMRIQNGVLSCCCVNPIYKWVSFWKCSPQNKLRRRLERKVTSTVRKQLFLSFFVGFVWYGESREREWPTAELVSYIFAWFTYFNIQCVQREIRKGFCYWVLLGI